MNPAFDMTNRCLPIPLGLFDKAFPLGFGRLPDNFPRNAHNNRMGRDHLTLPDKSPCGNEAPRANFSPREENGINPMRQPSPMELAWIIAICPTTTSRPIVRSIPGSQ